MEVKWTIMHSVEHSLKWHEAIGMMTSEHLQQYLWNGALLVNEKKQTNKHKVRDWKISVL